jgi:hypothetical protein
MTARCAGRTVPTTSVGNGCSVARVTALATRAVGRPATSADPLPLLADPTGPEGRPQPVSATLPDSSANSSAIDPAADAGNRWDGTDGQNRGRGVGEHKEGNGFMRQKEECEGEER